MSSSTHPRAFDVAGTEIDRASSPRPNRMSVTRDDPWLIASFARPVRVCSWAVVGGGIRDARLVAWLQVRESDLRPPRSPRQWLAQRLAERGLNDAVGLMTSRSIASYSDIEREAGALRVRCIATVGLGNALSVGDPPGVAGRIGTINTLVHVDAPLTDEALLEASALVSEAKALTMLHAGITSRRSEQPATGTGTDCTVIAAACPSLMPDAETDTGALSYAGKHTAIGSMIGASALAALQRGIARWCDEVGR